MNRASQWLSFAAAFTLSAFLTSIASAQSITGEVSGTVTAEGSALPGVAVTVSSPSLQGFRSSTTGMNGGYRISLLPPGRYAIRFELDGMESVTLRAQVFVASTTRVDATLRVAAFRDTITSYAPSHDIAAGVSSRRGDEIERLPTGRGLSDIALLSTGVTPNGLRGRLTISGAASWDSLFLVNGVSVNENLTGQPHNLFIEDAVEEVSVMTAAISAEYGRFSGGVVSMLTRSGGNDFTGSLRDSVTSPAWTRNTPWETGAKSYDVINHMLQSTLGGYAVRDRLWFFTAAQFGEGRDQKFTYLTNDVYESSSNDRRLEGKVTGTLSRDQTVVASYLDVQLDETNVTANNSARILETSSLISQRSNPTRLLALTYDVIATTNTMLEAQYSRKDYSLQGDGGRSTDRIGGTFINSRRIRSILNAPSRCGVCGADERNSGSLRVKAWHYRNTRWGNHTVVAGGESFAERRIDNGNRSASNYNIQTGSVKIIGSRAYPVFDSTTVIGWTPLLVRSTGTNLKTRGIFINDRWDVTRNIALSLGLRHDSNDARDADGNTVSDDRAISPRLAVLFDLAGDGRSQMSASFSRYASKILDGDETANAAQAAGVFAVLGWHYNGPVINRAGTPPDQLLTAPQALAKLFAWFDSVGGVDNRQYLFATIYPGYSAVFPGSLRSPSVDERAVSFSRQFGNHTFLKADLVARDWHHFYAARLDTTTGNRVDPLGNLNDVAWIVNDNDGTERIYRAIQLNAASRFGKWRARGGYTWSKLRGNDSADELTTNNLVRNFPRRLWYPELLGYAQRTPTGYLGQDQRHRARMSIGYETPIGRMNFSASLLQSFDSGRAYSAVGDVDGSGTRTPYDGSPQNPGYALTQWGLSPYYFSDRGAYRTDDVFSSDVAINFEFGAGSARLFMQADVLNIFDQAAVVAVDTEVLTLARADGSGLVAFNPFSEQPVEGVHYRLGPNFGKPTGPSSYQTPRTYRFSFGIRF